MATKLVPMGEGMHVYAGGAFGYVKPLPGTNNQIVTCADSDEVVVTDPRYKTKTP